eukprot:16433856-Heterocapsa_arctica.AAC.1
MAHAVPSATRARLDKSTLEPGARDAGASLGVTHGCLGTGAGAPKDRPAAASTYSKKCSRCSSTV